jgi:hypothetical protein
MNCAMTKPINKPIGGVIKGDRHNTNANKKMSSLVVMLLSNRLFFSGICISLYTLGCLLNQTFLI